MRTWYFLPIVTTRSGGAPPIGYKEGKCPVSILLPDSTMASLSALWLSGRFAGSRPRIVIGSGYDDATHLGRPGADALFSQSIGVFVSAGSPSVPKWRYVAGLDRLSEVLEARYTKEAVVCLDAQHWAALDSVARTCDEHGVTISIALDVGEDSPVTWPLADRREGAALKRVIDFLGAAIGLMVLAPFLAAMALLILVMDGRPVMFRQQRAGLHGRAFRIFKFRTMRRDADAMRADLRSSNEIDGAAFKMERDPRVTRLGWWLRRTSLDELPQLWNVLKGEMSLVGPRPHPYDDVARYTPWHLRRLAAKPGMTGLWQVELRGDPDFDRCVEKDIEYVERRSLWLDIDILWRTIPAVLHRTGR